MIQGNVRLPVRGGESRVDRAAATVIPAPDAIALSALSNRETVIALLVSAGLSNKEIGQRLEISHWTVSTHLKRIFTKLGISKRIEVCILVAESKSLSVKGATGDEQSPYRLGSRAPMDL